jgi:hypothetical protein
LRNDRGAASLDCFQIVNRRAAPPRARRAPRPLAERRLDARELGEHGAAVLGAVERPREVDARWWKRRCSR